MKKLLAVLVTMMSVSSVFACPGGDLIQVVLGKGGDQVLVASINKRSGAVILGKQVLSVGVFLIDGSSVCEEANCNEIKQISTKDLLFMIKMKNGSNRMKTISEVTIDPNMAVAKDAMPMPGQVLGGKDVDGQLIYTCSTKN